MHVLRLYTTCTVFCSTDAASGGSYDWVKGDAGVKYTYAYELRPKQGGFDGFVVDTSEIEPSGREVLASLFAMANAI